MTKFLKKDWLIIILGLIIGLGIGLIVVISVNDESPNIGEFVGNREYIRVGAEAPDFSLPDLNDGLIQLNQFRGKPVVVNFWATWCGPCRVEMPMLEAYYQQHKDNLVVLAVNMQEKEQPVQKYAQDLDLHFPIVLDNESQVSTRYRIQGLPTSIIVTPEGKISAIHVGVITENQLNGYLEK